MEDLAPLKNRLEREERARRVLEEMLGSRARKLASANRSLAEANAVLSKQREYAEAIVSTVPSGLLVIDADGDVERCNARAEDLLGNPPDLPPGLAELIASVHEGHPPVRDAEVFHPPGPGWRQALRISVQPMRADDGRLLVTVDDISARKHAEDELLQAKKLDSMGQLAAGIAHEINTPIQYVADNMRFLREAVEGLVPALEALQRLASQEDLLTPPAKDLAYLLEEIPGAVQESLDGVERVSEIVLAMKAFSHPGRATKEPVDLNLAISNTLVVSRNAWKYVADLETQLDERLPPIPALHAELNQVLLNIIVNAAQAIEESRSAGKGRIRIVTTSNGPWAEVRISDDGGGIPAHAQDRIFDPFYTTKEVGKGTGQGLALARSVVVGKLGGQLFFETEEGVGTTFVIRLPCEEAP